MVKYPQSPLPPPPPPPPPPLSGHLPRPGPPSPLPGPPSPLPGPLPPPPPPSPLPPLPPLPEPLPSPRHLHRCHRLHPCRGPCHCRRRLHRCRGPCHRRCRYPTATPTASGTAGPTFTGAGVSSAGVSAGSDGCRFTGAGTGGGVAAPSNGLCAVYFVVVIGTSS